MRLLAIERALTGTRPGRYTYSNGCSVHLLAAHAKLPASFHGMGDHVAEHYELSNGQLTALMVANDQESDPAKRADAVIAAARASSSWLDRVVAWWERLKLNGSVVREDRYQ